MGGLAIDIKDNIHQFVTKVAHVAEWVTAAQIITQIHGAAATVLNTHATDTSNAVDIRKEYWRHINQILYRKKKGLLNIGN